VLAEILRLRIASSTGNQIPWSRVAVMRLNNHRNGHQTDAANP
jgi:hypothetical protein